MSNKPRILHDGENLIALQGPMLYEVVTNRTQPWHKCPTGELCYSCGTPTHYPKGYWLKELFAGRADAVRLGEHCMVITSEMGTIEVPREDQEEVRNFFKK